MGVFRVDGVYACEPIRVRVRRLMKGPLPSFFDDVEQEYPRQHDGASISSFFVLALPLHSRAAWGRSPAGPKNGSAAEATSVTRDGQVNLGKSVVMNLRQESCAIIESC